MISVKQRPASRERPNFASKKLMLAKATLKLHKIIIYASQTCKEGKLNFLKWFILAVMPQWQVRAYAVRKKILKCFPSISIFTWKFLHIILFSVNFNETCPDPLYPAWVLTFTNLYIYMHC